MELPTEKRKAPNINAGMLLIYSRPKLGKTSITAQLENSLLIEHEPNGANFVDANVLEIKKPSQLQELFDTIKDKIAKDGKKPYKYLIVDTVTAWDSWSEIVGTIRYMRRPQGKKWNLKDERKPAEGRFSYSDEEFQTVHEMGQGYGYRYSREVMQDWFDQIRELADHVILLAHVKDKYVATDRGDAVEAMDINLTGKVKYLYCANVDAVAMLSRDGDQGILNFDTENSQNVAGGRCNHLTGKIVISEKQKDGSIKTFWDRIYLK